MDIQEKICGNAILMLMSLLPKSSKNEDWFEVIETVSTYEDKKSGEIKEIPECRGQLEPVVKLMIDNIHEHSENKNLKIIMLCTDSTLTSSRPVKLKLDNEVADNKDEKGKMSFLKLIKRKKKKTHYEKREPKKYTSVEYFKNRINKYVKENNRNVSIEYCCIDLDVKNIVPSIHKTTNEIRNLFNNRKELKLWIDIHGGFREAALICSAIISLLRLEDKEYEPEKILTVHCDFENKKSTIFDNQNMFDVFKFIGGMQDFAMNGNVDILNELSKQSENAGQDKIIDIMQTIADGIKECDPQKYINGIKEFSGIDKEKVNQSEGWLQIFDAYIEQQFGSLCDGDDILLEKVVGRCVDKGLYQQALTLIESKMPEYMMDNGLIYYEKEKEKDVAERKKISKTPFKSNCNFVFDTYISDKYIVGEFDLHQYIANKYWKTLGKNKLSESCILKDKSNNELILPIKSLLNDDNIDIEIRKKANAYFKMHYALKSCRNKLNHSSEDRPEMKKIVELMKYYLQMVDELLEALKVIECND